MGLRERRLGVRERVADTYIHIFTRLIFRFPTPTSWSERRTGGRGGARLVLQGVGVPCLLPACCLDLCSRRSVR
jgi:hypothetical protein